jgi:pimeloyl-ACP methyl ester carboxylesterase
VEFSVAVEGGSLVGWEAGAGTPALILHGGPATDNTETLVEILPSTLRTIRYQQRGIVPSTPAEPYDIETHVADAVRVLDDRGIERAWLIGHSWGGHLAFHLAVAHPGRVRGLIGIDPLGAVPDGGWGRLDTELFERLERHSPADAARAKEMDERAMEGEGTEEEALEAFELVWPYYFADPPSAPPLPETRVSVPLYAVVVASVNAHFERGTLVGGLPAFEGPFGIIHGEADPLPHEAGRETAALVPHATFDLIPGAGHLPWLEQPEAFRAAVDRILSSG